MAKFLLSYRSITSRESHESRESREVVIRERHEVVEVVMWSPGTLS